jgi:hypothetical protein
MRLSALFSLIPLFLASCTVPAADDNEGTGAASDDSLTGTTSAERGIHFEGTVYAPVDASDDAIRIAIARQVKTAIGALRQPKVALNDRAARSNVDPAKWTKTLLDVVDGSSTSKILKVTFRYDDRAVVTNTLASRSAIDFTVLADDYAKHADPIKRDCTDDPTTDTDSLWYHFMPQTAACRARIRAELTAIDADRRALGSRPGVIAASETRRWFLPLTAKIDPPKLPGAAFSPEYDRLFDHDRLTIYAFFGVDKDETDPDDALAIEAARFLRSMLRASPNFRPVHTAPFTWLLDFNDPNNIGKKLEGVTYDQMLGWIIDKSASLDLRKQALAKLAERWIYWDLPVEVNGKKVVVEVRSFFGYEDGSFEARQRAQWRYLEAFWHGDVFLYNGHSHFGHGPLEPTLYGRHNFNERYQIMLVGSCISFNYYHQDFLEMKPGGSKNLDMIVNGLPSWVWGGGEAAARFVTGLVSGRQPTYPELLESMRIDMPWGERRYDPMRVVDGELDNQYSRSKTPLTIAPLPPVY